MPTRKARKPVFSALSDDECRAVLDRNHVGRLAFLNHGVVDIEPVHYIAADSWIFVRSADGAKLHAFAHNPYVAFEVDEIDATFDWRSVVAHGTIYVMSEHGDSAEREDFELALDALRSFIPETLTEGDPTPFRNTIYGLHMDRVAGRMAEQRRRLPKRAASRLDATPSPPPRPENPDGF